MTTNSKPSLFILIAEFAPIILSFAYGRYECMMCAILSVLYIYIYWQRIEIYKYSDSVCGFFICFLTFVRYYLVPLLIINDNGYMSYAPHDISENGMYFERGILMTAWEMVCFSIFVSYQLPRWSKKKDATSSTIIASNKAFSTWLFIIVVFLGLLMVDPSVLNDYSFVLDLKPDDTIMEEYVQKTFTETVAIIGSRVLKIILPIPILCYLYNKYLRFHSSNSFTYSLIILVFFYGLILEGNSRNSIIIPAVAAMFVLLKLYPKYKKTSLSLLITTIALITILSVVWKSFAGNYTNAKDSSISYWISYIEVYFAGISNVGKAVYAYQTTDVFLNPVIAFNDLCRNVPFLNQLVDYSNTSSFYFANVWGRTDQVIPAIGNGLFYFGYLFSPVVSMLILKLAHYFENKCHKTNLLAEYLIYCYCSVVISYNMFNSVSTMMMKLIITLVPLLLALSLSKRLSKEK